jgi:kynurenine formamidase
MRDNLQWLICLLPLISSFIHGGAWRDPRNSLTDFEPAIKKILAAPDVDLGSSIRGFASINYRLSPYSGIPQDPGTPQNQLRNAHHPDHILDVWAAIAYMERSYHMGQKYILIGHSAGSTLAFQLLMGTSVLSGQDPPAPVPLPSAVIGLAGIYEFYDLNVRHGGSYAGFLCAAFGSDQSLWNLAAPACFSGSFKQIWTGPKLAVLGWSPEDVLIDEPEIDGMSLKLSKDGLKAHIFKDLSGDHNSTWQDGSDICRLVAFTIRKLPQI